MNKRRFKKGEIVSATRTFNGEIITGEFQGYHLFNDEIPDTVVGTVHVPGDGVYDVDVTSIRHHESKDERIRRELIEFIKWSVDRHFMREDFHQAKRPSEWIDYLEKQKECLADNSKTSASEDEKIRKELIFFLKEEILQCSIKEHADKLKKFVSYLEKQKEQDKCPEYCVRSHCIGCSIYEKEKEKWPIMDVFGFKVGDAVRLKDGDGRKHIIKSFEEIEGVHGPNFYHVEFEDNSARDGIYPGEEYPNGYYTQMEKFEEEQKPTATINGEPIPTENQSVNIPLEEWSEEDEEKLRDVVRLVEDSGHVKSIREHYKKFLTSLPERFNLRPERWSEDDEEKLERIDDLLWMLDDYIGDDCSICEERTTRLREEIKNVLCPFLKSLRPWKPTEEQMKALRECGECKRCIKELYEDLQKRYGTC